MVNRAVSAFGLDAEGPEAVRVAGREKAALGAQNDRAGAPENTPVTGLAWVLAQEEIVGALFDRLDCNFPG
jgi:hypothetical protein